MFEIGWTELLVIGVVALIVIGPKDLPEMFRTLGRFMAKMRGMAREFQRAMESAADQSGLKDVAKDVKDAANGVNMRSSGLDVVKDAARKFESWDPLKSARPMPASPAKAAAATPATQVPAAAAPTALAAEPPTPAAPAKPAKAHGPATQALADAKAARKSAVGVKRAPAATPPTDPAIAKPGGGA